MSDIEFRALEPGQIIDEKAPIMIPAVMLSSFRTSVAIQRGVERNILLRTWGGLGDQICAEPTLRYALKTYPECEISLLTDHPYLFEHLNFKRVFNAKEEQPIFEKYLMFNMIVDPTHLTWQFMSHMLTNCVDFCSLCSFRRTLPVADKEIRLPSAEKHLTEKVNNLLGIKNGVVVHAGRHWQTKTFPKNWWDEVLYELLSQGLTPILIGADTPDNRGTVDVNTTNCIDARNSLSIMESVALLQRSRVLLTNDSSPLHMAASGNAWIGFFATCKEPDMITHWRNGQWAWKMNNLSLGGIWEHLDYCPNTPQDVNVDQIDESILRSWLPDPRMVAGWTLDKMHS